MAVRRLRPESLTAEAFAPFGEVIETAGHIPRMINEGLTERYHALSIADVGEGRALINIFRTTPKLLPIQVKGMERHPLGSQAFIPLHPTPFLVLVAASEGPPAPSDLRLFITSGQQGVNYRRNTWHHYCLALEHLSEFLVVDRGGPGDNLEEMVFSDSLNIIIESTQVSQ